jgi:hypothetical protein
VTIANGNLTPPTGSIGSPNGGASVSSPVTVKVNASDAVGVRRVELWEGSVRVGVRDVTPPSKNVKNLAFSYTAPPGDHTLRVRVIDTDNNAAWSAFVTFRVR